MHIGHVTHAAGISSTGSAELDRRLPLGERYEIHRSAVTAVAAARAAVGRVIAAGTTAVRALEACAADHAGELVLGRGQAALVLGPTFERRVVDGVFTGMHAPGTSHFGLLVAFAPRALLERADAHAEQVGYLGHELGDSCLIAPERLYGRGGR